MYSSILTGRLKPREIDSLNVTADMKTIAGTGNTVVKLRTPPSRKSRRNKSRKINRDGLVCINQNISKRPVLNLQIFF
jgi:hypothetical protein